MPRDDAPLHGPDATRWPDLFHLAIGVWLGFSPWLLGFFDHVPGATWNALATGALVIVLATLDLETPRLRVRALLALAGLWLALSPVPLAFAEHALPTIADAATGLALAAIAAWQLAALRGRRRR